MAKFALTIIETDSDAFLIDPQLEIARILRDAADQIESRPSERVGTLRDINGNKLGYWLTPVEPSQ